MGMGHAILIYRAIPLRPMLVPATATLLKLRTAAIPWSVWLHLFLEQSSTLFATVMVAVTLRTKLVSATIPIRAYSVDPVSPVLLDTIQLRTALLASSVFLMPALIARPMPSVQVTGHAF